MTINPIGRRFNMKLQHDVRAIAGHFQIAGEFLETAPYGSGHINDTYSVVFDQGGTRARYISQRINHNIFKQPAARRTITTLNPAWRAVELGRRVLVCHVLRYTPFYTKVKEIIASGVLGEIITLNASEESRLTGKTVCLDAFRQKHS